MSDLIKGLKRNSTALVIAVLLLMVPLVLKNQYLLSIINQIFIFAAMGAAWNIIGGFGRQISWAHASFFCIGAYAGMLCFRKLGMVPWASLFVGMALAAVAALIMGFPSFRLRGTYFSLATIACGQIVRELIVYFDKFTGGNNGIMIPKKYQGFAMLRWNDEIPYYYLFFFLLAGVVLVTILVDRSRLGYYLKAVRGDQDAAESLGIRSSRIKIQAFMISAMCMSVIGTFYAFKMSYIDPTMVGSFDLAIKIGVIAIVGGIGTIWGPMIGSLIIIPVMEMCNAFLPPELGGMSLAIYGLILMLIVIFKPDGFWSIIVSVRNRITSKKTVKEGR